MGTFVTVLIRFENAVWRSWRDPEFRGLLTLVVVTLLIGTLFYRQAEGWSLLDSLYFSAVTLTTVGYGDLSSSTAAGKVFTILYIFTGLGIVLASSTRSRSVRWSDGARNGTGRKDAGEPRGKRTGGSSCARRAFAHVDREFGRG